MTFATIPNATPITALWKECETHWPLETAVATALGDLDSSSGLDPATSARLRTELTFGPTAQAWWERGLRERLIKRLTELGGHVLLAHDRLPTRAVVSELMRHVDTAALKAGTFRVIDHHLESLREYDGARLYIPDDVAARLRPPLATSIRQSMDPASAETKKQKGGRPSHLAKERYIELIMADGGTRKGRSVKEMQNMIRLDWGMMPPSPRALQDWEKEAKRRIAERSTE